MENIIKVNNVVFNIDFSNPKILLKTKNIKNADTLKGYYNIHSVIDDFGTDKNVFFVSLLSLSPDFIDTNDLPIVKKSIRQLIESDEYDLTFKKLMKLVYIAF